MEASNNNDEFKSPFDTVRVTIQFSLCQISILRVLPFDLVKQRFSSRQCQFDPVKLKLEAVVVVVVAVVVVVVVAAVVVVVVSCQHTVIITAIRRG